MKLKNARLWSFVCALALIGAAWAASSETSADAVRPHAGMMRFPDVSASQIVFVYASDLWVVNREGGQARPLASPPGSEQMPRFSPDGRTIAFVGNYDGDRDLYTIPVNGGVPQRVTHHPANEQFSDWTPDGRLLFSSNSLAPLNRIVHLYTVPPSGGMPDQIPVPYGAAGAVSEDGQWLAYTPYNRDSRTWKRYQGGMASDIWLFHLNRKESRKITDWTGTDTRPMWHGDTVYYLSDQGDSHRLNIWSYDVGSRKRRQITRFDDFDVKWPSIGPGPKGKGEIVFQHGAQLMSVDLKSRKTRVIDVVIPGDRPEIRVESKPVHRQLHSASISPTGKRALVSARGDIWSVPAVNGSSRNLTRTSGSAERSPTWSPDGRWIAYFCDDSGEYQLYVRPADNGREPRKLTSMGPGFLFNAIWSPDSKKILFTDEKGRLLMQTLDGGEPIVVDTDPGLRSFSRPTWSRDSAWVTYSRTVDSNQHAIFLYDVENGRANQVTAGYFHDAWPTFDRKGDYLYFASRREFSQPMYEDAGGTTFIYAQTQRLFVVPLRNDMPSPLAPKSDEEEIKGDEEPSQEKGEKSAAKGGEKKAEKKELRIDLQDFERRAVMLPVPRGNFSQLAVNAKGHLLYRRADARVGGPRPSLQIFDINADEKKEKAVLERINFFQVSADGKKMLAVQTRGGQVRAAIINPAPKQKLDKPLRLNEMTAAIDPRQEWRQVFNDAWRLQRDLFYDPNMHGVDWEGVRRHYAAMLDDCANREDVSYVIREMISEINVGHAYYRGGRGEREPSVSVGLLGADYELHNGAYRISRIIEGAPWDHDARGPLSQPGVDVKEGDYLLAVEGQPVDTSKDPWASFLGMAGKTITITVSSKPTLDDDARQVTLKALGSEGQLRFRNWIERNRRYVDEKSGGKVGYIYVVNTAVPGQNDLFRQFHGQSRKEALIIDDRWNGGGQIPTRFIELLNRPAVNYWARRHGQDWTWPPDGHNGPKCMLVNGMAGSGGDAFPYYFRQAGLGKLIGMRTWGGLVGISGAPPLIDGAGVTVPDFAFYENDGTWGIEGHGVDPDIEVIDDPARMQNGADPQMDTAIALMLDEIKNNPYRAPKRPGYPNRRGMGITEADK